MRKLNCLVTGASSGIGRALSIELAKIAKHIYIVSKNTQKLEETHDIVVQMGCECTIVPLDLRLEMGIENLSKEIYKKDKSLDIMILSAGVINELSPVDSINMTNLKNIFEVNYLANVRMIKCFHGMLKNSEKSMLALISSKMHSTKAQYWGAYQPIMTAINELFLIYANENKNTNIKANIFCPDAVDTKFREIIMPGEDKSKIKKPKQIASKILNQILNINSTGKITDIS